jgi:hypothetical protein
MTTRHRSSGAIVSLILAGTALGGVTLWFARRQGKRAAKPTELEGPESSRDSWLPDDVLDLPAASDAFASDAAGGEDTSRDDDMADIFDRPRG